MQRHFNCSDLEGAELEDQGVDGTALTHWEKRIFEVSKKGNVYSAVQKVLARSPNATKNSDRRVTKCSY